MVVKKCLYQFFMLFLICFSLTCRGYRMHTPFHNPHLVVWVSVVSIVSICKDLHTVQEDRLVQRVEHPLIVPLGQERKKTAVCMAGVVPKVIFYQDQCSLLRVKFCKKSSFEIMTIVEPKIMSVLNCGIIILPLISVYSQLILSARFGK